ncbi:transposase family protein [Streptomyces sp. NPDC058475]|uniref:transposase family protein n=1 Tax=Streptomyces sp. NPDC058475 TaxID=3346518 RepID=UPI003669C698
MLWASPALPGSTHDLTAARQHGIIEALTDAGLKCWAGKAYQGAGGFRPGTVPGPPPQAMERRHNTTHARIRCLGERAMATLKGWRLLRKLRCSANTPAVDRDQVS